MIMEESIRKHREIRYTRAFWECYILGRYAEKLLEESKKVSSAVEDYLAKRKEENEAE